MGPQQQQHDYLDRLPTELKCAVARSLTTLSDRKSLVLIKRAWADVALPLHWEGAFELLDGLATCFSQGSPCLKSLRIVRLLEQGAVNVLSTLSSLLLSFNGLQQLHIQCNDCLKITVHGIMHHGETLKNLLIINGGIDRETKARCFDASDLCNIAIACPELTQLCLNLYEIDTVRYESDILGPQPGTTFTPSRACQSCVFGRLTNPPNFRKAYVHAGQLSRCFTNNLRSGLERYSFQARADGLMRYLGEHHSNLKLLAFSPVVKNQKADRPDKHGHIWPGYYYRRGRMIAHSGADVAVAEPLAG
jgi:hypothetical protein